MITGSMLRDAFISAANNISNRRKEVDALNVFPVPDGDTGTNMSMTMGAAKRELRLLPDTASVGDVAQAAASALLRGARGNSGVILSLLFRGYAKALAGKKTADAADLVLAIEAGVEAAYKAVMKPTEGTILTVARESARHAANQLREAPELTVTALLDGMLEAAEISLANTPELLPVLKKAGVVDAGGKGFVLIQAGMRAVLAGGEMIPDLRDQDATSAEMPSEKNAAGEYEGEITFTYCTEFLVLKRNNEGDALSLRAYLESIGDSVVVVEDEEIIKCHVHTDNPGDAIQRALKLGMLNNLKIDNMRLQHAARKASAAEDPARKTFAYAPVDPNRNYGFVAVAAGDGVQSLFYDMGVDNVVSGGQTMNPSTDDLLEAIHATPARNIIVLPNNKNIIMAAEQTRKLADRNVYVLPTKSIPQGLSSLLAFDAETDLKTNQLNMVKAIEKVGTGQITFAARDSNYDGHKIKKGEILALENQKVSFVEKDAAKAVYKLAKALLNKDSTFITVLYGEDVSPEQAQNVEDMLRAKLPDSVELTMMRGGQPVYYYIISVE